MTTEPPSVPATSPLVAFLRARLDEDEAAVKYCSPAPWQASPAGTYVDDATGRRRVAHLLFSDDGQHIARHDPARVLREVESNRAILAEHAPVTGITDFPLCQRCGRDDNMEPFPYRWPCPTVRAMAAVHSDHPDYRAEWKPSSP